MNDGRQMELHYIDTGFPYTVTESFMDFFQGLSFVPVNYAHPGSSFDQESVYWSMNLNPYKFGYSYSGPGSTSYYGTYEVNDHFHFQRMEFNRGEWGCPMTPTVYEPAISDSSSGRDAADSSSGRDAADSSSERDAADSSSGRDAIATNSSSGRNGVTSMQTIPEECSPDHQESSSNQVVWQDNIDPDDMTYEELLDLGEAMGTQSRGLSQELIDMLPTSKYNLKSLFKRKNSGKRCVICQSSYKRGDQQIKLPCNHVYHGKCIEKWLSINKKCPICNIEVFGEESTK